MSSNSPIYPVDKNDTSKETLLIDISSTTSILKLDPIFANFDTDVLTNSLPTPLVEMTPVIPSLALDNTPLLVPLKLAKVPQVCYSEISNEMMNRHISKKQKNTGQLRPTSMINLPLELNAFNEPNFKHPSNDAEIQTSLIISNQKDSTYQPQQILKFPTNSQRNKTNSIVGRDNNETTDNRVDQAPQKRNIANGEGKSNETQDEYIKYKMHHNSIPHVKIAEDVLASQQLIMPGKSSSPSSQTSQTMQCSTETTSSTSSDRVRYLEAKLRVMNSELRTSRAQLQSASQRDQMITCELGEKNKAELAWGKQEKKLQTLLDAQEIRCKISTGKVVNKITEIYRVGN